MNLVLGRSWSGDFARYKPADYTDVIVKNTLSLVAKICTTDELVNTWAAS